MKQNMGRLFRYILIIHKLSGHREYIPGDELISYLNLQMELRSYGTLEKKRRFDFIFIPDCVT